VPFFVQANVAVNTKLTSKVPFLLGNFDAFKKNLVKNVPFQYGMTGKFFFSPPSPSPVAKISGKNFLGALLFDSHIFSRINECVKTQGLLHMGI
jgi:hypothetical protein